MDEKIIFGRSQKGRIQFDGSIEQRHGIDSNLGASALRQQGMADYRQTNQQGVDCLYHSIVVNFYLTKFSS